MKSTYAKHSGLILIVSRGSLCMGMRLGVVWGGNFTQLVSSLVTPAQTASTHPCKQSSFNKCGHNAISVQCLVLKHALDLLGRDVNICEPTH